MSVSLPVLKAPGQVPAYGLLVVRAGDGASLDIPVAEAPDGVGERAATMQIGGAGLVLMQYLDDVDGVLRLRLDAAQTAELYQRVLSSNDAELYISGNFAEGVPAAGCRDLLLPYRVYTQSNGSWVPRVSGPVAFLCPEGTEETQWLPYSPEEPVPTPRIQAAHWDGVNTYVRGQVVAYGGKFWVAACDIAAGSDAPGSSISPSPEPDVAEAAVSGDSGGSAA